MEEKGGLKTQQEWSWKSVTDLARERHSETRKQTSLASLIDFHSPSSNLVQPRPSPTITCLDSV